MILTASFDHSNPQSPLALLPAQPPAGVADRVQATDGFPLVRGINVRTVLSPGAIPAVTTDLTKADEVHRLSALGFTFARLPLAPDRLWAATGGLDVEALPTLDSILAQLAAGGVAAIVEIHGDDWFKRRVLATDSSLARFAAFWEQLAAHLAARYPARLLALEPLNEPFTPPGAAVPWNTAQKNLWQAVRHATPLHLIVLSGGGGSRIEGLERIDPVPDANVVYTFHFYEPMTFTLQGAAWPGLVQRHLSRIQGLAYPASCRGGRTVPETSATGERTDSLTESAAKAVEVYRASEWDQSAVEARIAKAATWAREHRATVFAGEFGVLRTAAPLGSRYRWLRDVRRALDGQGIPWALWEYKGGFGLLRDSDTIDEVTADALGLKTGTEFPRIEPSACW